MKKAMTLIGYLVACNTLAAVGAFFMYDRWRRGWCYYCGPQWLIITGEALILLLVNYALVSEWMEKR